MQKRPDLTLNLNAKTFLNYYYLKKEMVDFLRANGLPTAGGKEKLTNRIARYLETGEVIKPVSKKSAPKVLGEISEDRKIEQNFVCSEKHRAFFREKIGKGFSFNVPFQKWLKENAGKTYGDAIAAYRKISEDKKTSEKQIGKQFEYNAYVRAFFKDNPDKSLSDAVLCWKRKKSMAGHNRYERSDLSALEAEK